jgi:hypothetical protein
MTRRAKRGRIAIPCKLRYSLAATALVSASSPVSAQSSEKNTGPIGMTINAVDTNSAKPETLRGLATKKKQPPNQGEAISSYRIGNKTYFSNGTTCTRIGNSTFCN